MANVKANGVCIHYERTGGNKPALVLCHGITDTGGCWPRVAAALKKDYDLIMLDARGHGGSDAPKSGYSLDVLADDVAGVIDALGLQKPFLMGHSMGAMTVARTAAHYPNLVRGLVLEDPPWTYPPATAAEWGTQLDHVRADALARKDMTTEEMVEYSLCINPGMKRWDKSELDPWSEGKRLVSEHVMEGLRSDLPQWQDTVRRIACPTLLLTADPAKGAAITPAAVQRIMALNPKMKIVNIAEAGHNIRREAFEKYIEVVTAFLSNPGK